MALPIWGVLGGMTALFFAALFLRRQNMLEPQRVRLNNTVARNETRNPRA